MTVTQIIAVLGGVGMVLTAAARLPASAARAVRACIELVEAWHELRAAWRRGPRAGRMSGSGVLRQELSGCNEDAEA